MRAFFGILSFIFSFGAAIPYAFDILKGRARPARSTRILFFLLMLVTLFVQSRGFTSWVLLLTVGEVATQFTVLYLSIKHGIGGLARLDLICYVAFAISLTTYLITKDPALSLTLLMLTDLIAFIPTMIKIWRDPTSDSWLFFVIGGLAAAAASFFARSGNSYTEIAFPIYLFIGNFLAVLPIFLHMHRTKKRTYPLV